MKPHEFQLKRDGQLFGSFSKRSLSLIERMVTFFGGCIAVSVSGNALSIDCEEFLDDWYDAEKELTRAMMDSIDAYPYAQQYEGEYTDTEENRRRYYREYCAPEEDFTYAIFEKMVDLVFKELSPMDEGSDL